MTAWKSKDELLQQWAEQQHKELPLPPIPEPSCADEASLLLAQFRPIRRTPEELKRLLEARADPNIVIPTETWGGLLQAALRCRGHCRSTLSGLRKAPTALP